MSRDEFEHYDLSEFTEEELTRFDVENLLQNPDPTPQQHHRKASLRSFGSGGPALDIAFESQTGAVLVEEIPNTAVSARVYHSHLPASTKPTSTHVSRVHWPKHAKSPYRQFLSWKNGIFSVTDLVSPVWFVRQVIPLSCSYIVS